MVTQISKKELKRVKSLRKMSSSHFDGKLYWVAPDNKAYMCDTSGMPGVKEMNDWNKKIKDQLTAQASLL